MKRLELFLATLFGALIIACNDRGSVRSAREQTTLSPGVFSVSDLLWAIGEYFIYVGSGAVAIGILATVASGFSVFSFLAPFKNLAVSIIALGFALLLVGCSFAYMGEHPWIIVSSVVLGVGIVGYRLRTQIEAEVKKL